MSESGRSFDGGCFLFSCGCLSGGCLGTVVTAAIATALVVYSLQVGLVNNPRDFAYIHVEGDEMSPALEDGDWVLVERGRTPTDKVDRGDFVLVEPPAEARRTGRLFLRVVGLPGETISFGEMGILRVDGKEDPVVALAGADFRVSGEPPETKELGEGEYYLLGEDPLLAKDSRHWGPIAEKQLRGTAVAILYPPNRMRTF